MADKRSAAVPFDITASARELNHVMVKRQQWMAAAQQQSVGISQACAAAVTSDPYVRRLDLLPRIDNLYSALAASSEAVTSDPYVQRRGLLPRIGNLSSALSALKLSPPIRSEAVTYDPYMQPRDLLPRVGNLYSALAASSEAVTSDPYVQRRDLLQRAGYLFSALAASAEAVTSDPYVQRRDLLQRAGNLYSALAASSEAVTSDPYVQRRDLLQRAGYLFSALAEHKAELHAARRSQAALHQQASEGHFALEMARREAAACSDQYEAQLPLLVVGSADLQPMAEALLSSLGNCTQLICRDIGRLLHELIAVVSHQRASKDVAAMASRMMIIHKSVIHNPMEKLMEALPVMVAALAKAAADPFAIHEDPELMGLSKRRGQAMLDSLGEAVPTSLPKFAVDLDSLATVATSFAQAIESEHGLEAEDGPTNQAVVEDEGGVPPTDTADATPSRVGDDSSSPQGVPDTVLARSGSESGAMSSVSSSETAAAAAGGAAAQVAAGSGWGGGGSRWVGQGRGLAKKLDDARRRAFANSALRRAILKMEGRDGGDPKAMTQGHAPLASPPSQAMSVAHQVDALIRQSTSVDNLSQMFEGWTPWL
eukprot:gene24308-9912_t